MDMALIFFRYFDVGERNPHRYGSGTFTEQRRVHNIAQVEGGEQGTVRYRGKDVPVYRRSGPGWHWGSDPDTLKATKVTKVF
jgi:hypothetical protein